MNNQRELKLIKGWEKDFIEDYWIYSSLDPVRVLLQQQAALSYKEGSDDMVAKIKQLLTKQQ
jgi:hypothetical protein